jgi:chromosome partitioning protein
LVIILCTHHKGGVGKSELAIHIAGVLRSESDRKERILLLDCDSQASAWEFYFRQPPSEEGVVRPVEGDSRLSLIWNPSRERLQSLTQAEEFGHFVIDIDSPLANTVQAIVQDRPSLILIPVNYGLQPEALLRLGDPLAIIADLESKIGLQSRVRIVPLGAQVAAIRARLAELEHRPRRCDVAAKVRNLQKETRKARQEYRYVWEYSGCEDLKDYYHSLIHG